MNSKVDSAVYGGGSMNEDDPAKLIAVIGDAETCVGFVMAGIGQEIRTDFGQNTYNFFVVEHNTCVNDIENAMNNFLQRNDINIIIINQKFANLIRSTIDSHLKTCPVILEIPSSDHPYDSSQDSIMKRAKLLKNC